MSSSSTSTRAFTTRRQWRDLIGSDPTSSFSRPYTVSETYERVSRNLNHFRSDYAALTLAVIFLSLIFHPISLIVFIAVFLLWLFLYFSRSQPLVVLNRSVDDRFVSLLLFILTLVSLLFTGVWINVLVSVLVAVLVVGVHAAFRVPEDLFLDEDEAASGGLLSVVGGSPSPRTRSKFASV